MEMYSVKFNENDLNVEYVPQFIGKEQADTYLSQLRTLPFFTPTLKLRGRNVRPKRQVIAFGDPGTTYAFSGTSIPAEPWTPLLLELRDHVERQTACAFNYVLLNLYADGTSYISPHKDDESGLDATFPIAVLSFGAERTITFSRPKMPPTQIKLQHGSLYIMDKPTNDLFTHGIARDPAVKDVRISLTFRRVIPLVSPSKKLKQCDPQESSPSNSTLSSANEVDLKWSPFDDASQWISNALREIESENPQPETESTNPIHAQWDLSENTFVQIVLQKNFKIRIHIRTFKDSSQGEMIPSKKGVVMTPQTWYAMQGKLLHLKLQSVNDSFVANNQLLVASVSEKFCIMQQIFPLNTFGFYLKPAILKLTKDQISNLSLNSDITESIIEAKLLKVLPRFLSKKSSFCNTHMSEESAKENLLMAIALEVKSCIDELFYCLGCSVNHSSQHKHECIYTPIILKFRSIRQHVLLSLNVFKIAKNLPHTCFCHYHAQCLKDFNPLLNDFIEIENMLEKIGVNA